MDTMGDRIARRRKELGLKQQQIADKLGIVRQTVSLWENGHTHDMHSRHLRELARVLDVEPDWILNGGDDRSRPKPIKCSHSDADLCEMIHRLTEDERDRVAEYIERLEEESRELYRKLRQRFGE